LARITEPAPKSHGERRHCFATFARGLDDSGRGARRSIAPVCKGAFRGHRIVVHSVDYATPRDRESP